jgi:hypothetical protein
MEAWRQWRGSQPTERVRGARVNIIGRKKRHKEIQVKRLLLVGMEKRRVGVTARLRQIGGGQTIGSRQIATEPAAPLN